MQPAVEERLRSGRLACPSPGRVQPGMYASWRDDGRPITLEPEDVGWARIFYGHDPDGHEVMFKQFLG